MRTTDGRWYLRRVLPYRTLDNVIDGVVVTFVNMSELKEAQRVAEAVLVYADTIVNVFHEPLIVMNREGRVVTVNQAYYTMFRARKEDTVGTHLHDLGGGRWHRPELDELLGDGSSGATATASREIAIDVPGLGRRPLRVTRRRVEFGTKAVAGETELTLLALHEIIPEAGNGGSPTP